jgi:hypothetical protein
VYTIDNPERSPSFTPLFTRLSIIVTMKVSIYAVIKLKSEVTNKLYADRLVQMAAHGLDIEHVFYATCSL